MIRRIITIDEEKCNDCVLCADACHEGAIGIVDGKAKLLREDNCDDLGDCLLSVLPMCVFSWWRSLASYALPLRKKIEGQFYVAVRIKKTLYRPKQTMQGLKL